MLRFSEDEFSKLQSRIAAGCKRKSDAPVQAEPQGKAAKSGGRRNKYGAQATEIEGIRFDSKAEARRYLQLKAMEQAGEITGLEIQIKYELIPAQGKERPVFYVADFRYTDQSGAVIVEDTKSAPTKTKEYVIKRKLMKWIHGIEIREVLMD